MTIFHSASRSGLEAGEKLSLSVERVCGARPWTVKPDTTEALVGRIPAMDIYLKPECLFHSCARVHSHTHTHTPLPSSPKVVAAVSIAPALRREHPVSSPASQTLG